MAKLKEKKNRITIAEYAAITMNRRGFPVSVSYIYRLIRQHQAGLRDDLDFNYEMDGQAIYIIKK
jgi:hypothetical protein